MVRLTVVSASIFFALLAGASAQTPEKTDKIIDAWRGWMKAHKVKKSAITIGHNGKILKSDGVGQNPKKAYAIASLSKAITAVCLQQVAAEKNVDLNATLGELQPEFSKVKVKIPSKLKDRTLASVITMTSGMKPDRSQGRFNKSFRFGDTRNIGFSNRALKNAGLKGKTGAYFYNNGNYALAGALLEALTGTDNVTACRDRVFPKGHRKTVRFDKNWIALAGFGGWQASTVDYTAFVMNAFGPKSHIAANLTKLPNYRDIKGGWGYGLGTFFRTRFPQNIYWHKGALCGVKGGDFGTYFAYYASGYAITVTYNACGRDALSDRLDSILFKAAN
ncbi:MAG: serine hydrolase domain-containing protein [Pseudomonadota bacterium]